MKVFHVIDSGGFYGAESMLLSLCLKQIEKNLDVEVISIGLPGEGEKDLERQLNNMGVPLCKWRMKAFPDIRQSRKILNYCENNSANIIHSHGYKGNILLALLPKSSRKVPIISTVHGYTSHRILDRMTLYQLVDKLALRRLDAVVLVSESVRMQMYRALENNRTYVIPNGVPLDEDHQSQNNHRKLNDSDFNVIAIGRLCREKNFKMLVEAFFLVLKEIPHAKLSIFGEGEERENLQHTIKELNLEHAVQMPGYIDDTSSAYQNADVFVNSSITEGMPITILEAMKAGCQIVATNIPANQMILREIKSLVALVDISSVELSKGIIGVGKKTSEQLEGERESLKTFFRENYTIDKCANRYISLYESLQNR